MSTTINLDKLSINIDQQSTLARLLAQENINVIHGNYRTAWFDPEKRVLALPIWKNRGKAVYDLLTGHEVGHALYTPAKGWHDAVDDITGAPKAYLNVLEDVRIERKIQDKYPGLRSQFKKAYKVLADEDFFGLSQLAYDFDDMLLIDRINLHYKLGDYVSVEFADGVEKSFMQRAFKTQTFEDVVALAKEIYEYQKQLRDKQPQQHFDEIDLGDDEEENDGVDANDYNKPDPNMQQSETDPTGKNAQQSNDLEGESKDEESKQEDEVQPDSIKATKKPDHVEQKEIQSKEGINTPAVKREVDDSLDMLDAITDAAFRNKEKELTADDMSNTMVYTLNKVYDKNAIIDYKLYYSQWKKEISELPDWRADSVTDGLERLTDKFKKFKNDTESAGAYMAKEFELRKAAYQYSRSSVHKTGLINTNKLHAYKYSEDIFLKSTKLANYKNHGMMMFIDFSGSMQDNIGATIRQILNLTTFCKMVNIPYEVYAFTTRVKYEEEEGQRDDGQSWKAYVDCEVMPQKFNLLNLMSSRMSRSEYQEGFRMLWNLSMAWDAEFTNSYINSWNQLHSTPLNTCIAFANEHIKSFKAKHGVEKMITMFLTDGASDSFQVRMTEEGEKHRPGSVVGGWRYRNAILRFGGTTLDVKNINSTRVTQEMLRTLKKNTDSTVLGFFISQYRNEAVSIVCDATSYSKKDKYVDQMNKNRAIIEDNIFGYDRYFGLCQKYMDIVENEFGEMVEDGASKNKLKTAFAKMTKAKRVNRILLNAFVDAIA
jgi:hypothetical protein